MTPSAIHFNQIPAAQWPSLIDSYQAEKLIPIWVSWGAHESTRGISDFNQASRLNLEKLLKQIQEKRNRAEIIFGFDLDRELLPEWTWGQTEKCYYSSGNYQIQTVPSLFEKNIKNEFIRFSSELFQLIGLYVSPGGPVEKVSIRYGFFARSWNPGEVSEFSYWLKNKFQSIMKFNQVFQTSFSDFEGIKGIQALRVLGEKRPWLLYFYFKEFRKEKIDQINKAVELVPSFEWIKDIYGNQRKIIAPKEFFLIDDTHFDYSESKKSIPLCPWGAIHSPAVSSQRLSEFLIHHFNILNLPIFPLSELSKMDLKETERICLMNGKYIPSKDFLIIEQFIIRGGKLFFPFGLPHYDEELKQLDWQIGKPKENDSFKIHSKGKGKVFTSIQNLFPSDELAVELGALIEKTRYYL